MIHENSPVTNTFVSVPSDMGHLNCAAFAAGIIAGMLDSARFVCFHHYTFLYLLFLVLPLFPLSIATECQSNCTYGSNRDRTRSHHFLSEVCARSHITRTKTGINFYINRTYVVICFLLYKRLTCK